MVDVTPEGFTEYTGFIPNAKAHKAVYHDLQKIEIIKETSGIGRSKSSNCYLICHGKDGAVEKVPAGADVIKAAFGKIGKGIQAASIPVINQTCEP